MTRTLVTIAVVVAACLGATAQVLTDDRGTVLQRGGPQGDYVGAALAENGTAPDIVVRIRTDAASTVRVDARLIAAIDTTNHEPRAICLQDTSSAAKTAHTLFGNGRTWWNAFDGDSLRVWVRVYDDEGDLQSATFHRFKLDAPGVLMDYAWRSSHSIASGAVAPGWIPGEASWATVFDQVTSDTDGTSMRYGGVRCGTTYQDSTYFDGTDGGRVYSCNTTAHEEDNGTIGEAQQMVFIWFDMSSIPHDAKIADAKLYLTTGEWTNPSINVVEGSGYVTVRMDTVAADLQMLQTSSPVAADPRVMNISWNSVRKSTATAWSPTLLSRTDWHDYGPQAANKVTADVANNGVAVRFDVTDAIQQWVSNKRGQVNGPFVVTAYNATAVSLSIGNHATYSNGNPTLVVRWVQGKSYESPWGDGVLFPLVFSMDDGADEQLAWADTLQSYGYQPTFVVYRNQFGVGTYDRGDLADEHEQGAGFSYHSATHPSLGQLSTRAQMHKQLAHSAIDTCFHPIANVDTTAVAYNDFAWPVNGVPVFSILALQSMIDHGYRSARAVRDNASPIGTSIPFGLDDYVNLYMIESFLPDDIVGAAADNTKAQIKEALTDIIDLYYTDYGRQPYVIYAHNNTSDITNAQVGFLGQLVKYNLANVDIMTLEELVTARTRGQSFVLPAAVPTAAACYDSLYQLGDTRMAEVWLGPFE